VNESLLRRRADARLVAGTREGPSAVKNNDLGY